MMVVASFATSTLHDCGNFAKVIKLPHPFLTGVSHWEISRKKTREYFFLFLHYASKYHGTQSPLAKVNHDEMENNA